MYDVTDPKSATWENVPGSDPGNDYIFSAVPLANGGNFCFFSGSVTSGTQFQLPSTGYPAGNMLAWASPAGAKINYHSACFVQECEIDENRVCTLVYSDASDYTWGGDINLECLTWLSVDAPTQANGLTWLTFTLLGGEEIMFGMGTLADGQTIQLPDGWSAAQCFARAYIHDQNYTDHIMYLAGAWIDNNLGVHCMGQDHSGNTWTGRAAVLIFVWKNNAGTVAQQTVGQAKWITIPLTDGSIFGVGIQDETPDGTAFSIPAVAGDGSTLEVIVGPGDSFYTSSGGHAQGIGSCYLDQNLIVHCTFNQSDGDTWTGHAHVFATFYQPPNAASAGGISVAVTPSAMSIALAGTQQFTALVSGTSTTTVNWSVDGIAGGSADVGTVDATGLYTAPSAAGVHTITATSTENAAAYGSQAISVGTGSGTRGAGSASIIVSPSAAALATLGTCQFAAIVSGSSSTAVTWSVNGIAGGNPAVGTIDANGLYTAGTQNGIRVVTATLTSDSGVSGSASVGIGLPTGISRSIGVKGRSIYEQDIVD